MGGEWEAGASGPGGGGTEETGVTYVHTQSFYIPCPGTPASRRLHQARTADPHVLPKDHPETPDVPSPSGLRAPDQFILRNRRGNVEMFMGKYYFGS